MVAKSISLLLSLIVLMTILNVPPLQANAPGYRYELLFYDQQFPGEWIDFPYLAVNRYGEVLFVTKNTPFPNGSDFKFYTVVPGMAPSLVTEATRFDDTHTLPIFGSNRNLGINDDGIVAIPLQIPMVDDQGNFFGYEFGFHLFDPDTGQIAEIRPLASSSGNLNIDLELGGSEAIIVDQVYDRYEVFATDGTTKASSLLGRPEDGIAPGGYVQINEGGAVALRYYTQDAGPHDTLAIGWAAPPGALQTVVIGNRNTDGYSDSRVPGLNDLGWMSFNTNDVTGNPNPGPRVFLISPTGQVFDIADTTSGQFLNFPQARSHANAGVSLNNFNRVSFIADTPATAQRGESIWIGDASGDLPRLAVVGPIEFTNGWVLEAAAFANDVTSHGANSLGDAGEIGIITFGTLVEPNGTSHTSTKALFLAIPEVGAEPGNPILPDEEDNLPEGFRFRGRCWRGDSAAIAGSCDDFGGTDGPTPRTYYDPAVAVGYTFTIDTESSGAFDSVLVPIPLAGGDGEFSLEADGVTVTLLSGKAIDFSSLTSNPVRSFVISGIDIEESLDPSDPTVFVTGLTFAPGTDEDVSFTMTPIELDPDLTFEDGFESP